MFYALFALCPNVLGLFQYFFSTIKDFFSGVFALVEHRVRR